MPTSTPIWPPCVKGAVERERDWGIVADNGQPLRQKSKIFATSPYTGEAFQYITGTSPRRMVRHIIARRHVVMPPYAFSIADFL